MKRVLSLIVAACCWLAPAAALTPQERAVIFTPRRAPAAPTYQGPGDVIAAGWLRWGSCARVFTASLASTSTSLCDLVAVTTPSAGAVICTLRATSTGFVDLAASYCNGTTPSAACTAAGGCAVTKVYDQTAAADPWSQVSLANMPTLQFSSPGSGGLPSLNCFNPASCFMAGSASIANQANITLSTVYLRQPSITILGGIMSNTNASAIYMGVGNGANKAAVVGLTEVDVAVTDTNWNSENGMFSTTASNCALNINGGDNAGLACGVVGWLSSTSRIMRSGSGNPYYGNAMEFGILGAATTATDRNNLSANQHNAVYGYNF